MDRYARARFKRGMQLSEEEVLAFEDYFYHIMAARGSGEHALRHLLGPMAWAKHPLEGRLHDLKVGSQALHLLSQKPVWWVPLSATSGSAWHWRAAQGLRASSRVLDWCVEALSMVAGPCVVHLRGERLDGPCCRPESLLQR